MGHRSGVVLNSGAVLSLLPERSWPALDCRGLAVLLALSLASGLLVACSAAPSASPAPRTGEVGPVPPTRLGASQPPTRPAASPHVPTTLETTTICFQRLSYPEDEEGLRTQIGPAAGVVSLIVEPDDTMTVVYDSQVLARSELVSRLRQLGFSALDEPCRAPTTGSNRSETTVIPVRYDTYETEETVGAELGRLRGVLGAVVTQTEIVVTYNPDLITLAAILDALAENPEVRVRSLEAQ